MVDSDSAIWDEALAQLKAKMASDKAAKQKALEAGAPKDEKK